MPGTMIDSADAYFKELHRASSAIDQASIASLSRAVVKAWEQDACVHIFGNGGSHANASHAVADFVKTAMVPGKRRLRALCMSDNLPMLTALANDVSYEDAFRFPLESYARAGDLAIAISCSGNSPNILAAARWARESGLTLAALTGQKGGKVAPLAHIHINVPSDNFGVIEDLHMSVLHIAAQSLHHAVAASGASATAKGVR